MDLNPKVKKVLWHLVYWGIGLFPCAITFVTLYYITQQFIYWFFGPGWVLIPEEVKSGILVLLIALGCFVISVVLIFAWLVSAFELGYLETEMETIRRVRQESYESTSDDLRTITTPSLLK